MRTTVIAAAVYSVAVFSLAGCDGGGVIDKTIQAGVRESAVQACVAWLPQSEITLAAGLDQQELCGCAVDRMMKVRNVSDLAGLRPDSPEGRAAIAQCIAQTRSTRAGSEPG